MHFGAASRSPQIVYIDVNGYIVEYAQRPGNLRLFRSKFLF